MKKWIALIIFTILGSVFISNIPASALSTSDFQAGRIIDDDIFYDKDAMGSAQDVQNFITNHTPSCDTWGTQASGYGNLTNAQYAQQVMGWPGPPYVCLQNYHENPSTSETSYEKGGGAFTGGLSAGKIIWDASQKYSINPQVLLVTLRKESLNLFSDSWPLKSQYRYAMGYACPDSGPNYSADCAPSKAGFYKQVDLAAWQLRYYYDHMGSYNYAPGRWNTIQYNPQPSCGTKDVYIENYATASLYIYTPYTPNDGALQAYPGTAPCGAYGNRNFWFMFNEWFGSTIITNPNIISTPYVDDIGWTSKVNDSGVIGTTSQSKSLQAITIQGELEYSTYNPIDGWQNTVNNGMISGTVDRDTPIQAVKLNPIGALASKYDIYYRAHVSNIGWMDWTKNSLPAGVTGSPSNNIEAIEIRLVLKQLSGPTTGSDSFRNIASISNSSPLRINASAHISVLGWQPSITDSMIAGTIKQKRAVEAIRLTTVNNTGYSGGVVYSAHVAGVGWQDYKANNVVAGTTGQSRQMEAIRVSLTGELSNHYDVWYRAHIQDYGWLSWTKNNLPSGSTGQSKRLEAFEVRITPKDSTELNASGTSFFNTKNRTIPDSYIISYTSHAKDLGWLTPVTQGVESGTTRQSRRLEAIEVKQLHSHLGNLGMSCSVYSQDLGWSAQAAGVGSVCGTTGQSRAIQALNMTLTGDVSTKYNLSYQVHVSNVGWMNWVNGGNIAGTPGENQIEAVRIKLTEK